jgi:hypothetical protein
MPGAMPPKGAGPAVVVAIGKPKDNGGSDSSTEGNEAGADQMPPDLTKATEDPTQIPEPPPTIESVNDKLDMVMDLLKTLTGGDKGMPGMGGDSPDMGSM